MGSPVVPAGMDAYGPATKRPCPNSGRAFFHPHRRRRRKGSCAGRSRVVKHPAAGKKTADDIDLRAKTARSQVTYVKAGNVN